VNFRTAYVDDDLLVQDTRAIATRYLRGWFLIDFLSTASTVLNELASSGGAVAMLRNLRILRLVRLMKLMKLMKLGVLLEALDGIAHEMTVIVRLVKIFIGTSAVTHLMACGFYVVGFDEYAKVVTYTILDTSTILTSFDEYAQVVTYTILDTSTILTSFDEYAQGNPSWQVDYIGEDFETLQVLHHTAPCCTILDHAAPCWTMLHHTLCILTHYAQVSTHYLIALYWAFVTVTTVGFGDICPQNNSERMYVLFCTFLGTSVFAYMVGEITTLSARKHSSVDAFANKMDAVEEYMRFHNLPKILRDSVRRHYRKTWHKNIYFNDRTINAELSYDLRRDVALFLKKGVVSKVPFFKDAPDELISLVVCRLVPRTYMLHSNICVAGAIGKEMYILEKGEVHTSNLSSIIFCRSS
jgi:hypothetical protein